MYRKIYCHEKSEGFVKIWNFKSVLYYFIIIIFFFFLRLTRWIVFDIIFKEIVRWYKEPFCQKITFFWLVENGRIWNKGELWERYNYLITVKAEFHADRGVRLHIHITSPAFCQAFRHPRVTISLVSRLFICVD